MSADCFAPLGIIPNAFAPRFARVPNPLWRMLARTVLILASEDYDHERHRRHNAANAVGLPVEPLRVEAPRGRAEDAVGVHLQEFEDTHPRD